MSKLLKFSGGGKPKSPTQTDDTLFSEDVVELVLGICEGEILGLEDGFKSFFIGDVPYHNEQGQPNFTEIQTPEFYPGTPHEGTELDPWPVVKFALGGESTSVAYGVQLRKDIPVLHFTPEALKGLVHAIEVRLQINQLYRENSQGTFTGTARFQISWKPSLALESEREFYANAVEYTITGKTTGGYIKDFMIPLPPLENDTWEVKVVKFNEDIENTTPGDRTVCEMTWDSLQTVTNAERSYKNLAYVHIVAKSGDRFASVPQFSGIYKGLLLRTPGAYNGVTRTMGVWDGIDIVRQYTNAPAWVTYNLIMDPVYGLKKHFPLVSVNPYEFVEAQAYCDALVSDGTLTGKQPRYSFDALIDRQADALETLFYVAGSFNGVLFDGFDGKLHLKVDKWREPALLFTPETATMEGFNYTFTEKPTRYNDITVSYLNPNLGWEPDKRRIKDDALIARNGRIPFEFEAVGCIHPQEALRRAYFKMITANTEVATVSFVTTRLALILQPFDNIWLSDPIMGWGLSGRIKELNQTVITLRDPIFFATQTNFSFYLQGLGQVYKLTVVPRNTGECLLLDIFGNAPDFDTVPPEAQFSIQDEGDFGLAKPFRILNIEEIDGKPDMFRITAAEVNPDKYAAVDNAVSTGSIDYSFRQPGQPAAPYEVKASSGTGQLQITGDGTVVSRISLEWKIPAKAFVTYFLVQYQEQGSDQWNTLQATGNQVYLVPVKDGAIYEIQIQSVNALGVRSAKTLLTHQVVGKSERPSDVTKLDSALQDFGVRFFWPPVADLDVQEYELRLGEEWESGVFINRIRATEYAWVMQRAGDYNVMIKAVDTSGNYSENATSTTVAVAPPGSLNITLEVQQGDILVSWTKPGSAFPVADYELRRGDTYEASTFLVITAAQAHRIVANFQGSATFWVTPIDAAGNRGANSSARLNVTAPEILNLRAEVIDNNVLLRWVAGPKTFPLADQVILTGDPYLMAVERYRTKGGFAALFENKGGSYTYWVVPIDSAGNQGTPQKIVANVNQPPDYVLFVGYDSTFTGTRTNLFLETGLIPNKLVGAVDETETYAAHFALHGFSSWQDAVDAGYPCYATPGVTTFSYEEEVDYGTVLAGTTIRLVIDRTLIHGSFASELVTLSVKELVSDPWIDYVGQDFIVAGNFQYVKFRYEGVTTDDASLFSIDRINLRLDTKLKTDQGKGLAFAADSGGTVVNFNIPFFDITSIVPAANSTSPITAVYDFVDVPNPTSFKILLFDEAGVRVDGSFSWTARGY